MGVGKGGGEERLVAAAGPSQSVSGSVTRDTTTLSVGDQRTGPESGQSVTLQCLPTISSLQCKTVELAARLAQLSALGDCCSSSG